MTRINAVVSQSAAAVGVAALLILSVAILADAICRSVFLAPIFGLSDLVELTAPVIVASCFPMALTNRQHITIRFLGRALPSRPGQAMEFFGQTVTLCVFVGISWHVGLYTADLIEHRQFTWLLEIPIWPSWMLATFLIAVCVPIQAAVVGQTWAAFRGGAPLKSEEDLLLRDAE